MVVICQEPGCHKQAKYGEAGCKKRLYCHEHGACRGLSRVSSHRPCSRPDCSRLARGTTQFCARHRTEIQANGDADDMSQASSVGQAPAAAAPAHALGGAFGQPRQGQFPPTLVVGGDWEPHVRRLNNRFFEEEMQAIGGIKPQSVPSSGSRASKPYKPPVLPPGCDTLPLPPLTPGDYYSAAYLLTHQQQQPPPPPDQQQQQASSSSSSSEVPAAPCNGAGLPVPRLPPLPPPPPLFQSEDSSGGDLAPPMVVVSSSSAFSPAAPSQRDSSTSMSASSPSNSTPRGGGDYGDGNNNHHHHHQHQYDGNLGGGKEDGGGGDRMWRQQPIVMVTGGDHDEEDDDCEITKGAGARDVSAAGLHRAVVDF